MQRQKTKHLKPKPRRKARRPSESLLKKVEEIEQEDPGTTISTSESKSPTFDNRAGWSAMTMSKTAKSLQDEFNGSRRMRPIEFTILAYEANESKNRYTDIVCIDSTRVILKDRPEDEDYIHANWMVMPNGRKYISTQAPLSETVEDFWHMIFTEKSTVIVMLCSLTEGKTEKCTRYYPMPQDKCEIYGPYKITIEKIKRNPFETVKYQILRVEKLGSSESMTVHHLMNHSWLDHISPIDPAPIVGMLKLAKKHAKSAPITVHCSAGVGRTGTFVGIDLAAQRIEKSSSVKMLNILRELRSMRMQSIQSATQYKFLHICLLELFVQDGVIRRSGRYSKYLALYQTGMKRILSRLKADETYET